MVITAATICLIIALVLFLMATFGASTRFNLVAAGLAALTLAFLLPGFLH